MKTGRMAIRRIEADDRISYDKEENMGESSGCWYIKLRLKLRKSRKIERLNSENKPNSRIELSFLSELK